MIQKRFRGIVLIALLAIIANTSPVYAKSSCGSAKGSPIWMINKINLNLYVTDTPLWYTPQIGPEVEIRVSYNSQAVADPNAFFGNKWQFNYQSYLTVNTGTVTVTMPDGRIDVYTGSGGTYTAPTGVFSTLTKTGVNRYELTFTDGEVYIYDIPAGTTLTNPVLVSIRNAYSQPLAFGYTGNQLVSITDAQGRVTTIEYTNSLITRVNDPFGRSASFGYTGGELTSITDMGGYVAELSYQANAGDNKIYISSITNKGIAGLSTPETWSFYIEPNDGINNNSNPYPVPGAAMWENYRITVTDPLSQKEEYYYYGPYSWYVSPKDYVTYVDAATNNLTMAKKTLYFLDRTDPRGRISKIQSPEGGYEQYSNFDAATNQAKTVTHYHGIDAASNPILHSIFYTYNPKGMTTSVKDAKDNLTNIAYYQNNVHVQTITNGQGTISFTWNAGHDITSITDRMNITTAMTYNTYGLPETITRAQGTPVQTTTELIYDPATKNLTNIKKNGNTLTGLTYDPVGRVQTQTDATGITLSYDYNNLDKVTKVTFPDNKFQTFTYSAVYPHITDSVTDRSGLTTTYIHDALKRLTQVAGPNGTFSYEYDANSNLTKLIDANLNQTLFDYDSDNQLIKKTFADGKFTTYTYDKAGMLKMFTNARNITKSYEYDTNDNLTSINYSDSTPAVGYVYDNYDRVQSRSDGIGTTGYTYDVNNRLITVDGPLTNDIIAYDYNELGRMKSLTPEGGQVVSYGYDQLIGRLRTITTGANVYTYDYVGNSGMIQNLTRPNGSVTEYEYNDPLKRLTAIRNKKSTAEIINSFAYTYNNLDLKGTETITNGEMIDNFIAGTTTYTSNNLNQTTSTTNPDRTYVYDDDGNMTSGYTPEGYVLTMTFDADNRMKTAEYTDSESIVHGTEYGYSGDSFLAEMKKFENGIPTADRRYLRAGFLPIQERDVNNLVTREYVWGENLGGGIGGLLSLRQGGNDYAYLYDGKGNVSSLLNGAQSVVAAYAYDPFGVLMKKMATIDQPYMFSTKEYDAETGLSYYGYRVYEASIGKWTTRDPLGETGGVNLYGFVGNSTMNWLDPLGLTTWPAPGHVTSEFGAKSPTRGNRPHTGIDIANSLGGNVIASDSGIVVSVSPSSNGTNQVIIRNEDGSVSGYAHVTASVKSGQEIREGEVLGNTDLSGITTGPHLHYTYRLNNRSPRINPRLHLPERRPCK